MSDPAVRSLRRFSALALGLALAACSARGPGGSFSDDGGTGPATVSFTCAQLCAPLAGEPTCGAAGVTTCTSSCDGSLASTPAACVASANALYACTSASTPRCTTASQFPFASCQAQYAAYVACLTSPLDAGAGPTDAGVTPPTDRGAAATDRGTVTDECSDAPNCGECTGRSSCGWCAGRCWSGRSTGPSGGSCGDTPWAWTSPQCSSSPPPRDAGGGGVSVACQQCATVTCPSLVQACMSDPACVRCVAMPEDGACVDNPAFREVAACACGGACTESCGAFCGGF
jgi:hypothetical protein